MYIEKRWLMPGILSLLLFGALFAVALVLLGQQIPVASGAAPDAGATAEHRPVQLTAALCEPDPAAVAPLAVGATLPPPPPVEPVALVPERPQPEEQVSIATQNTGDTQINTRGFGDIGMQFQDVTINAPITNVHISNQGNNNATNVAIGDDNVVVSRQKDLESDRTGGGEPPASQTDGAERTTATSAGSGEAATTTAADATPHAGARGGAEDAGHTAHD